MFLLVWTFIEFLRKVMIDGAVVYKAYYGVRVRGFDPPLRRCHSCVIFIKNQS